ncbi:MAG: Nif11-like leader peptide family natural product precursor [Cyanobacteria bacterium J06632_22]
MAKEQVARLFREAKTNLALRETLNTAPNPQSFVKMANQKGFSFTLDEWKEMMNFSVEELECELSEIPGI